VACGGRGPAAHVDTLDERAVATVSFRRQPALSEVPAAVSDQGRGIRSKGERPPTRGAPQRGHRKGCSQLAPERRVAGRRRIKLP